MYKKHHRILHEKCHKAMRVICEIYGFIYHEGEYYSTYLLDAVGDSPNKELQIDILKNEFDANLEPFKLQAIILIGHMQANGYIFDFLQKKDEVENRYFYEITVKRCVGDKIKTVVDSKLLKTIDFEYAAFDAAVIAAEHFETAPEE